MVENTKLGFGYSGFRRCEGAESMIVKIIKINSSTHGTERLEEVRTLSCVSQGTRKWSLIISLIGGEREM